MTVVPLGLVEEKKKVMHYGDIIIIPLGYFIVRFKKKKKIKKLKECKFTIS